MKRFSFLIFIPLFLLGACGGLSQTANSHGDLGVFNRDVSTGSEVTFLFATDYSSAGQLYVSDADATTLVNTGVSDLGSSAIIRLYNGLLYVLHDGFSSASSDNVHIIDPSDNFSTVDQWSTGNGTNPQDIVVIGAKAYITLYNPSADSSNVDADGNPGDLIIMDLQTGDIEKRISFHDLLNADGDLNADASRMLLIGTKLYVLVQDLQYDFSVNTSGHIAIIDTDTDTWVDSINLIGENPVSLAYSSTANKLFIAHQAPYNDTLGNFDTSTSFGGVEVIPVDDPNNSFLFDDEDLGGYVEQVTAGNGKVFVVVSQLDPVTFDYTSQVLIMDDSASSSSDTSVFLDNSSDVRSIALDSFNDLWIARRSISSGTGTASDPQVEVFDSSGSQVGTNLVPVVPVTSIAIGKIL